MSKRGVILCLVLAFVWFSAERTKAQSIFLNLATDIDGTIEIEGDTWNQIPAVDPPAGGAANFSEVVVDDIYDTAGDLLPDVLVAAIGGYNTNDQNGFGFGGEDVLDDVAISLFWGGPLTPESAVEIEISGLKPGKYEVGVLSGLDNRTTDRIFDIEVNGTVIEDFDAQDAYDTGEFPVLTNVVVSENGRLTASTPGEVNGEHLSGLLITPMTTQDPCDFDGDGSLGVGDIDALAMQIQQGANPPQMDLNDDQVVDAADLVTFVTSPDKLNSWVGDSNLDGEFNSSDFVQVFTAGQYEDGVVSNSTWATGDWNGDGDFDSSDFVFAFTDGGYERGRRPAVAVPEPGYFVFLTLLLGIGRFRRNRAA